MLWARMMACVTGTVNQELLLRNEYLGAENRILRGQFKGRLLLSEGEKATLADIAQRLGRKALEELAAVAKPDTLLAWYRKLVANKFDGSRIRQRVGRPRIDEEAERLVFPSFRQHTALHVFEKIAVVLVLPMEMVKAEIAVRVGDVKH